MLVEGPAVGGLTATAEDLEDCFRVAVEEEVEGGEAETLLTTDETTERSTGVFVSMNANCL